MKAYYERALEQIGTMENSKKVQQQQHEWATQEQERLKAEVDRLGKVTACVIHSTLYAIYIAHIVYILYCL